jgi:hypothetical protein
MGHFSSGSKPRRNASPPEAAGEAGFVEVSAAQLLGAPSVPQTVLELLSQDGTRLTLRLAPGTEVDVVGLVQGFRGRVR